MSLLQLHEHKKATNVTELDMYRHTVVCTGLNAALHAQHSYMMQLERQQMCVIQCARHCGS